MSTNRLVRFFCTFVKHAEKLLDPPYVVWPLGVYKHTYLLQDKLLSAAVCKTSMLLQLPYYAGWIPGSRNTEQFYHILQFIFICTQPSFLGKPIFFPIRVINKIFLSQNIYPCQ